MPAPNSAQVTPPRGAEWATEAIPANVTNSPYNQSNYMSACMRSHGTEFVQCMLRNSTSEMFARVCTLENE